MRLIISLKTSKLQKQKAPRLHWEWEIIFLYLFVCLFMYFKDLYNILCQVKAHWDVFYKPIYKSECDYQVHVWDKSTHCMINHTECFQLESAVVKEHGSWTPPQAQNSRISNITMVIWLSNLSLLPWYGLAEFSSRGNICTSNPIRWMQVWALHVISLRLLKRCPSHVPDPWWWRWQNHSGSSKKIWTPILIGHDCSQPSSPRLASPHHTTLKV